MCLCEQVRHFPSTWQQIPPCKRISSKAQRHRGGRASPQHRYVPVTLLGDQSALGVAVIIWALSPHPLSTEQGELLEANWDLKVLRGGVPGLPTAHLLWELRLWVLLVCFTLPEMSRDQLCLIICV